MRGTNPLQVVNRSQHQQQQQQQAQSDWLVTRGGGMGLSSTAGQLSARRHRNSGAAEATLIYKSSRPAPCAGKDDMIGTLQHTSGRRNSSGGGQSSSQQQNSSGYSHTVHTSNSSSNAPSYTAALLKRQAAAGALHNKAAAAPAANRPRRESNSTSSSMAQAADSNAVGALTSQLLGSVSALSPGSTKLPRQQQQQQQQPSLQLSSARRSSSAGGSSTGSYAAIASTRSAYRQGYRSSCSAADDASGAATAAGVAQSTSQQLSCALSALEAVTATNTAAAAVLRSVATTGAARNAAGAAAAAAGATVHYSAVQQSGRGDSSRETLAAPLKQPRPVPPLPLRQQASCSHTTAHEQPMFLSQTQQHPAAGCWLNMAGSDNVPFRVTSDAGVGHQRWSSTAAAAAVGGGLTDTGFGTNGLAAVHSSRTCGLEREGSTAGGIGYSKLRHMQASSAGAATPRSQLGSQQQRVSAHAAAYQQHHPSSCKSAVAQQQQRQHRHKDALWTCEDAVSWYHAADGDDDSDGSDNADGGCSGGISSSSMAAAAARGAFALPMSPAHMPAVTPPAAAAVTYHLSPRPRLLAANNSPCTTALQTVPAAALAPGLLTTGAAGIEYAKLSRSQQAFVGSPACVKNSPRLGGCLQFGLPQQQQQQQTAHLDSTCAQLHTEEEHHYLDHHQQQYQQQQQAYSGRSNRRSCAKLVTGWYSSGLQSGGSEYSGRSSSSSSGCSSSEFGSPEALLLTRDLPDACSGGPYKLSQEGEGAPAAAATAEVIAAAAGGVGGVVGGGFDLRPFDLPAPLGISTRDASVTELLEASQQQILSMESTLASMLQVAKRWTDGGCFEVEQQEPLRHRFSGAGVLL